MRKITCTHCESSFRAQINQREVYCPFCGLKFVNEINLREASTKAIFEELKARGVQVEDKIDMEEIENYKIKMYVGY